MPLVHISLRTGKPAAYRQAICDGIYQAMRDTFSVPEDDQFMTVSEHESSDFRYGASYLGVARSDNLVFIQITANASRSVEQKKALYQCIAQRLGQSPGLRPEDVFVNIVEVARENWSLGHGLAQYA
ncbi:tautomerase family protein [Pandoraea apista]|uniref:tautomerase family protein n=1 Tax=Pandoraea apista TaxID=93218 RepID=UPI0006581791|nr:tautomerase family protein [Pandoraea apista]ALS67790.1 tautomerase family protein [Pandoraea apista]RRW94566.1 tautomerase family protein [Pandoraea apista]RRX01491.1 tautomerase family protein [Pandoraea apista]CFB63794.1 4-oxalocrotonate tautomerase [Pandoraea apista]